MARPLHRLVPYEVFEHTADIGLDVRANRLEELLQDAACGMMAVIRGPAEVKAETEIRIDITHERLERLLVDLLDEVLFHQDADGLVFANLEVIDVIRGAGGDIDAGDAWTVHAVARGEPFDRTKHRGCVHVKGVTFHELGIKQDPETGGWVARVILDI